MLLFALTNIRELLDMLSSDFKKVALRTILYTGLFFLLSFINRIDFRAANFKEGCATELGQEALLVLIIAGFFIASRFKTFKYIGLFAALFFLTHLIRERDATLDAVFDGLWQLLAFPVAGIAVFILFKNWKKAMAEFKLLYNDYSFGVLFIGFLVLHVFSRLFGKGKNWEALMGVDYERVVKDAAEESIELLAYGIILIGTIEIVLLSKRLASKVSSNG
jgi:hypothetical protein